MAFILQIVFCDTDAGWENMEKLKNLKTTVTIYALFIWAAPVFSQLNCHEAARELPLTFLSVKNSGETALSPRQAELQSEFDNSTGMMNPRLVTLTPETPLSEFRSIAHEIDTKAEAWMNESGVLTAEVTFANGSKGVQILPIAGVSELNTFAHKQMRKTGELVVYSAEQQLSIKGTASYRFNDHTTYMSNREISELKPESSAYHEGRHARFGKKVIEGNPSAFSLFVKAKKDGVTVSDLQGYHRIMTLEEAYNYVFDLVRSASTLAREIRTGTSEAGDLLRKKFDLAHEAHSAQMANEAAQKYIEQSIQYLKKDSNAVNIHIETVAQPGKEPIEIAFLTFEIEGVEFSFPVGPKNQVASLPIERQKALDKLKALQRDTRDLAPLYSELEKALAEFEPPYGPTNPVHTRSFLASLRSDQGVQVEHFPVGESSSITFVTVKSGEHSRQISLDVYEGDPVSRSRAIEMTIEKLQKEEQDILTRSQGDQSKALKINEINSLARRARSIVQSAE